MCRVVEWIIMVSLTQSSSSAQSALAAAVMCHQQILRSKLYEWFYFAMSNSFGVIPVSARLES